MRKLAFMLLDDILLSSWNLAWYGKDESHNVSRSPRRRKPLYRLRSHRLEFLLQRRTGLQLRFNQ